MPVFRVQVNYKLGVTGKWSNVWHVSGADLTGAADAFETEGAPDLLPLLDNSATMVSLLVSDEAGPTFLTRNLNAAGTNTGSGDLLPLFNSCKAFFDDGSFGRPDYKYFKGFVTESIQTAGVLTSGAQGYVVSQLGTLIADMITAGYPLVSSDNDQYATASVQADVQMRQMHRKRKKTVTP
jgi:hypothetical protein